MNRLRDLDASTGVVSRIGELDVSYIASTSVQNLRHPADDVGRVNHR